MTYRCVATSVAGFVQQLAVCYVARGYYFYVAGRIPQDKDPAKTDEKIIGQYGIDVSRWVRARRKKWGWASLQYLRHGRFFVILANHGEQLFFEAEARRLQDVRETPIQYMGYSIGCRHSQHDGKLHVSVRIAPGPYQELKARFKLIAGHRSVEELARELRAVPYEPFAPVRDQMRGVLRAVNRRRQAAGLELVPYGVLRTRRAPIKPFGPDLR